MQTKKNQLITITFILNHYIIKIPTRKLPPLNHIPLLHNKNTNKQTMIQEKTNPIPKIFPFIFISLILLCKPFSLTFNSSIFFINATMILFLQLFTSGSYYSKKLHHFLHVTYMAKINPKINRKTIT